jgi:hypothetical protein
MTLCGKVEDVTRIAQTACIMNKDPAGFDFLPLHGLSVMLKVARVRLPKLQSDPFAHDSDRVNRVDESLNIGLEQIA